MGSRSKRRNAALASTQTAIGARNIQAVQGEQAAREQQLTRASQLLGTDEQIAGYGVQDVSPYASRYGIDEDVFSGYQEALRSANRGQGHALGARYGDRVGGQLEASFSDVAGNIRARNAYDSLQASGAYNLQERVGGGEVNRHADRLKLRAIQSGVSEADWAAANASIDSNLVQNEVMKHVSGATGGAIADLIRQDVELANQLLTDAQAAAEAGDTARADQLKAEADSLIEGIPAIGGITGKDLFRSSGGMSPEDAAKAQLSSPLARTVGELVKMGRDFADPESAGSQRFKSALTEGATAQIDRGVERQLGQVRSGERSALRQLRDTALTRGGGRQLGAEAAIGQRITESAAQSAGGAEADAAATRATIHGEAAKFFETYRTQFSQNVAGFAQAWLQNDAGIRDQYQNRLMQTGLAAAQFAQQASAQATQMYAIDAGKIGAGQIVGQAVGGLVGNYLGQGLGSLTAAGVSSIGSGSGGGGGGGGYSSSSLSTNNY